jgi:hypothetical protein
MVNEEVTRVVKEPDQKRAWRCTAEGREIVGLGYSSCSGAGA